MSRRRIPNGTVSEIGAQRIDTLMDLSIQAVRDGREDRSKRYVDIARSVGMKTRVTMPKDRKYCKKCHVALVPGINCRVRLSNHKVCITCGTCGEVRRYPYIKEQKL